MSDRKIFIARFKESLITDLGSDLYYHYFERRKHHNEPMPTPEEAAAKFAEWLVDEYINDEDKE